jgi:mRNA interferase RelE/StbE
MELTSSKSALKFLKKLSTKELEKIQTKLLYLLNSVEESGLVPFNELDIKTLDGEWQGFLRMRIGKIRVVFTIDAERDEIQVYEINFRSSIYQKLGFVSGMTLRVSA